MVRVGDGVEGASRGPVPSVSNKLGAAVGGARQDGGWRMAGGASFGGDVNARHQNQSCHTRVASSRSMKLDVFRAKPTVTLASQAQRSATLTRDALTQQTPNPGVAFQTCPLPHPHRHLIPSDRLSVLLLMTLPYSTASPSCTARFAGTATAWTVGMRMSQCRDRVDGKRQSSTAHSSSLMEC